MRKYTKRPWTYDEKVLLTKVYHKSTKAELAEIFPDRSYNACVKQAKYLRERRWPFRKK